MLTVVMQLIAVPVISRLYSSEDYGVLAIFNLLFATFNTLLSVGFSEALMLPKGNYKFVSLSRFTFLLALFIAAILSLFILTSGQSFLEFFGMDISIRYFWLVIPFILLSLINQLFISWHVRNKKFKLNALVSPSSYSLSRMLTIVLGIIKPSPFGLIIGQISIPLFSISIFLTKRLRLIKFLIGKISIVQFRSVWKEYGKYPTMILPATWINTISSHLPVLIFSILGIPVSDIGHFAFANSILSIPANVIGNSVRTVFLSERRLNFTITINMKNWRI